MRAMLPPPCGLLLPVLVFARHLLPVGIESIDATIDDVVSASPVAVVINFR